MYKILFRCEVCKQVFELENQVKEDFKRHIKNGDVFNAPCKLNGNPSTGVCVLKEHYESCQKPDVLGRVIMNNWMCWRDGVLIEVKDSTPCSEE